MRMHCLYAYSRRLLLSIAFSSLPYTEFIACFQQSGAMRTTPPSFTTLSASGYTRCSRCGSGMESAEEDGRADAVAVSKDSDGLLQPDHSMHVRALLNKHYQPHLCRIHSVLSVPDLDEMSKNRLTNISLGVVRRVSTHVYVRYMRAGTLLITTVPRERAALCQ